MRRLLISCLVLSCGFTLSGCAIVSATANVVGAAGTLVGTTVNAAAGAVGSIAGGGHKSSDKKPDCAGKDKDTDACKPPPVPAQ
jgi:hypothetical protein